MTQPTTDTTPALYQNVIDAILTITEPTEAPHDDPACYICSREYGSAGSSLVINLDLLSQLPGAVKKNFVEHTVEPVRTSCGHTFCLFCLGVWFNNEQTCTCPICRHTLRLPANFNSRNIGDETPVAGFEGLSANIQTPEDAEFHRIVQWVTQTRPLLTTTDEMPFIWITNALIFDLPMLMVSVARRFHLQSLRLPDRLPEDPRYTRRHDAILFYVSCRYEIDPDYFVRDDAPLAKHEHVLELYGVLCRHIENLKAVYCDVSGLCGNWEGPARAVMYKVANEDMPEADGGVGRARWMAYVWCVIKAVFVWQAYCYRVQVVSGLTPRDVSPYRAIPIVEMSDGI
ncbi:HRD1 [Pyrenophora teres f. teres]|uniref:HRD1 n=1 Tax=Pyrenophora teres f. teres TaxID=97479 RepID=A0A6S6VU24_9PLEO|nr:HRD1 [Pyrenophora teres f. teres]